jgi:alpha-ribazole phosphatase
LQAVAKDTRIYLVRHGEPALPDGRKRFVGQSDPPLSPSGARQAHLLADSLKTICFDALYSSDLQRCLSTADILSRKTGLSIQHRSGLREIDLGLWEGLCFEEVGQLYPEEHARREADLVGYRIPGGESFSDLQKRVVPAFFRAVDESSGSILLVSHKGVNRVLLCHFLGLPLTELFSISQDYCCVNIIRSSVLPDGSRKVSVEAQNRRLPGRVRAEYSA